MVDVFCGKGRSRGFGKGRLSMPAVLANWIIRLYTNYSPFVPELYPQTRFTAHDGQSFTSTASSRYNVDPLMLDLY
jgi:hypothetical protein